MCAILPKGKILITVGTTQFDALIQYTDSNKFLQLIAQAGIKTEQVTYQYGTTGKYTPVHENQFRLHPNIQQIYDSHEVIITHGGAGTLLACLYDHNPKKKVIAVANNTLAGNHQTQLVTKLDQQGYILGFNSVEQLQNNSQKVLKLLKGEHKLRKYQRPQKSVLNTLIFGEE